MVKRYPSHNATTARLRPFWSSSFLYRFRAMCPQMIPASEPSGPVRMIVESEQMRATVAKVLAFCNSGWRDGGFIRGEMLYRRFVVNSAEKYLSR